MPPVLSQNPGTRRREGFQVGLGWEGCRKLGEGARKAAKRWRHGAKIPGAGGAGGAAVARWHGGGGPATAGEGWPAAGTGRPRPPGYKYLVAI